MFTLLLIAAAAALGVGALAAHGYTYNQIDENNKDFEKWLREQYPDLTESQIRGIIAEYGDNYDRGIGRWFTTNAGDQTAMENLMKDIEAAYEKYGAAPEALSPEDLARIQEEAYNEIDTENQRLLDLYNQSFENSETQLQNALLENSAMFGDYRNQVLTNEAMRQQAIAGSVRFELDRQQRNAITRGASAAQRLVAGINSQLSLQAQSAQQALDTSNALAQNLLAHRQAQQGVRNDYFTLQNQHNRDIAGVLSGQAERRYNYGQDRKQGARNDYKYAYDLWNENVSNAGLGQVGEGIYRNRYGNTSGNSL